METVETWWNGRTGAEVDDDLRRDARLIRVGELWQVEIRVGGPDGEAAMSDPGNERYARRLLASAMETGDGWRQVG